MPNWTPNQLKRFAFLKWLWKQASSFPNFRSFGCGIDEEVKQVWGDWTTSAIPFTQPYNMVEEEEQKPEKDPNELSSWGRQVVDRIRKDKQFNNCKISQLSDKELARKIWEVWEGMRGTNKLRKITDLFIKEG